MTERRIKRLYVSEQMIMNLFAMDFCKPDEVMCRFRLRDISIPDDVEVVNCGYDCSHQGICLTLSHPTWPEINMGEIVPLINHGSIEIQGFKITNKSNIECVDTEPISNWRKLKGQF